MMMIWKKAVFMILAMLILVSSPALFAQITTQSHSDSTGRIKTDWETPRGVDLPQFDTSLGRLVSVKLTVHLETLQTIKVENTSDSQGSMVVTGKVNMTASLPDGTQHTLRSNASSGEQFYSAYDGLLDYGGTSGRIDEDLVGGSQFNEDTIVRTYTGADIDQFIGSGTVVVSGTTESLYNVSGATGTVNVVVESDADLEATIEYTYSREADLELIKTASPSTPSIGETVTYTLSVFNNGGPLDVDDVVIEDVLPSSLQFVSTSGDGSYDFNTGEWTVGAVAIDETKSIDILAIVLSSGETVNTAEIVQADLPDPDSTPDNGADEDDRDSATIEVPTKADLELEKTVSNATPDYGDQIDYTLTVTNTGPDAANNVVVTDELPTGLVYVSDSGSYNANTGEWSVGSLASGENRSLTIRVRVNRTGSVTNSAEVTNTDAEDPDSTPDNDVSGEDDQDDASINIPEAADLRLSKTTSVNQVRQGEEFYFELTLTNDGPDAAQNVEVTDVLDTRFTLNSFNASKGSFLNDVWSVASLANGETATLRLSVELNTDYQGVITNVAEITGSDTYDPDSTPGSGPDTEDDTDDSDANAVEIADLSLVKSVDNSSPDYGSSVTYTLTLTNSGPDAAESVQVTDNLPSGLSFVSATSSQGSYSQSTGLWTVGTLASGATATLDITADVVDVDIITNTASVTHSDQLDPDSDPGTGGDDEDDQDDAPIDPVSIDLDLSKTSDKGSYYSDETITFTLTLTNTGRKTATNVTVEDAVPAGLNVVSASPSLGTWTAPNWSVPELDSDASATLTLTAEPASVGTFTNTAEVTTADQPDVDSTPDNDDDTEDDQDDTTIEVRKLVDLSLDKEVNTTTPAIGETVTFTLTLSNAGPDDATNIVVTDVMPDGLTVTGASSSDYNETTGEWSVASLAADASTPLTITATVDRAGLFDNVAEVTAQSEDDQDSVPDNDDLNEDDQDQVSLEAGEADLELSKQSSRTEVMQGVAFDFDVTVTNTGPNDVTDVRVIDVLPAGLTLVDTPNGYNPNTGVWMVGGLAMGESRTLTLTVEATTTGAFENEAEITVSDVRDPDSTPGNDVPDEDDQSAATVEVYAPGSIGDTVWSDYDGDGVQDAGEPGLAGITLYLLDADDNQLASTVTDANGSYLFETLDVGTYQVDVDESTVPDHYNLTTNNDPMTVILAQSQEYLDADFGYQPEPASIGDRVWQDLNNNKTQDSEDGLENITVQLKQGDVVLATTQTDASGTYLFTDLIPGDYTINIVESTLPENWELTTDNEPLTETLSAGENYRDADFGYRPIPASIGDTVWQDIDGEGDQDSGEPPVAGVSVILLDAQNNPIDTTVTDAAGQYVFDDLEPGTYTVQLDVSTLPAEHSLSTPGSVTTILSPAETYQDADFGLYPARVSIGDAVVFDLDEDGVEDPNEGMIDNIRLFLLDENGNPIDTTFTDQESGYLFDNLPYGRYIVKVDTTTVDEYYTLTSPSTTITVELEPGEDYRLADFGFFHYIGGVCGVVYHDANFNGVQDEDESGLPDVTVRLFDESGVLVAKISTRDNGRYSFQKLDEGRYRIVVDYSSIPENYRNTTGQSEQVADISDKERQCGHDFGFAYDKRSEFKDLGNHREVLAWYDPGYADAQSDSTLRQWQDAIGSVVQDTSFWGLFDSHQNHQWEYDILQAWLAGIDAFVVDWQPGAVDPSTGFETVTLQGLLDTADELNRQYGDQGFDFRIITAYHDDPLDRVEERFTFLQESILHHPAYYGVERGLLHPLFIFHEPGAHSASELRELADQYLPEDIVLAWNEGYDWDVFREMDLLYPWVQPMNKNWDTENGSRWGDEYLDFEYANMNKTRGAHGVFFAIGAVWPGYDARGKEGSEGQWINRQDTLVYHKTWEKVCHYEGDLEMPWVLLQSWNDYNQSTHLDLSVKNQYRFLEMTHDRVGRYESICQPEFERDLAIVATQHLHMARLIARQRPQESWMIQTAIHQAFHALMQGEYYKTISILDLVIGIAPNPMTIDVTADGTIECSWTASPHARSYQIRVATDSSAFRFSSGLAYRQYETRETSIVLDDLDLTRPLFIGLSPKVDLDIPSNWAWYQNAYTGGGIYRVDSHGIHKIEEPAHTVNQEMTVKELPSTISLAPNYPNPFNPETTIEYTLDRSRQVTLTIYDVQGREIERLVDQRQSAGTHRIRWNATGHPSGVYLYRLRAGAITKTRRMLLIK
jgi:uncharacterized repeat protein (TIGR01451 family)